MVWDSYLLRFFCGVSGCVWFALILPGCCGCVARFADYCGWLVYWFGGCCYAWIWLGRPLVTLPYVPLLVWFMVAFRVWVVLPWCFWCCLDVICGCLLWVFV